MFSIEDPFRLSNPGEMLPLRLWARPGRESLRLLNALSGCELVDRMRDPGGASLLHRLQRDILLRKPEREAVPEDFDREADGSIVVLPCDSPRRELEAIAAEIWSLLRESGSRAGEAPLRFSDIGVLIVPSRAERYESLVAPVFREAHGIPLSVADLPLDRISPIAAAVSLLLEIPLSSVSRSSLLRFATHPAVTASFPGARDEDWLRWGNGPELDDSLSRLALAAFSRRNGNDPDPKAEALDSAAAFGALLRSLAADAKDAVRAQMTLPSWMDFTGALVTTYLEPRTEADERVLRSCLETFAALAEMTLAGKKVRYSVAHELIRSALESLSGSRGESLVDGVSVSRFHPMRPIPYRVLFLAGLSEGDFASRPSRETEDALDLTRAHRRAGDVGGKEEDRQLFLEALLSAREKLYLSYVSKDERTGARRAPASVVSELLETLAHGYLRAARAVIRLPLSRGEDVAITRVFPDALREKNALALGEHLKRHLGSNVLPPFQRLKRSLPERVARTLALTPIPARARAHSKATLSLSLSSLREFLECPLQASARFHLRLDDGRRVSDEPGGPPSIRGRHLEVLAAWQKSLSDVANGEPRIAPAESPGPPLLLTAASRRIELLRAPETRLESPPALLRLASRDPDRFHPQKESLRGFLDHVYLCAAERSREEPYTFLAINAPPSGEGRAVRFRFAPIESARARSYLEGLVTEILSGVHEYLLPCEVIFGFGAAVKPEKTSSILGPVPHPEDYRPPGDADREALVQRRFGLYFESLLPPAERT
jgi:exodeoxyribonuclease V gamma subunit